MNLDLRKAVAEALGCKPGKDSLFGSEILVCKCPDYEHGQKDYEYFRSWIPSYDTDHHAALDALMEFCEKNGLKANLGIDPLDRQVCSIWGRGPMSEESNKSLAIAICEAIKAAAEGKGDMSRPRL